jgi:hypothetical protein
MQISLALVLGTMVAVGGVGGCSGGTKDPVDPGGPTDGGSADGPPPSDGGFEPPALGFQVKSPLVDLDPGADLTFCYYFHMPNKADLAIKGWESLVSAGVQDIAVYQTAVDIKTPGTMSTEKCGFTANNTAPTWTYSSNNPDVSTDHHDAFTLPNDDGSPSHYHVAQAITAGQPAFMQIHFVNPTTDVLEASLKLNALAYPDNESSQVTRANAFVTFDSTINVPRSTQGVPSTAMVQGKCAVSPNLSFFSVSVHTFKQGTATQLADGTNPTPVYTGGGMKDFAPKTWDAAPFYSFTSGSLSYQCKYSSMSNLPITSGDNEASNETCMVVGFYFSASGSATGGYCRDGSIITAPM